MKNVLNARGLNYGLVRTKEGIPRIANPRNIPKIVWDLLDKEIKEGKYTLDDCLRAGVNVNG